MLGLGQGPGNALAVLLSSGLISEVNTFVFVDSVVSISRLHNRLLMVSCHVVSHFCSLDQVKEVSPFLLQVTQEFVSVLQVTQESESVSGTTSHMRCI